MNPFKTTGSVKRLENFYGFKDQKKQVFDVIDQSISGEIRNICFIGDPETGKTSFLNISKEYADQYSQLSVFWTIDQVMPSYEFFHNYFSNLLQSLSELNGGINKQFVVLKKDYDEITIKGAEADSCNLLFPYKYLEWVNNHKPVDDFPNYSTIIKHDINAILKELKGFYKDNLKKKIFFFIDDFQYVCGFNDKGKIDPNIDHDLYVRSTDNICTLLRYIVDDFKSSIVLFIATYPGVFKKSETVKKLTGNRYFEKIDVDKYEHVSETEELFTKSLQKLDENHIWRQVYGENVSIDIIKNILKQKENLDTDALARLPKSFFKGLAKNEKDLTVITAHNQYEGRPSFIKHFLAEIFETFNNPTMFAKSRLSLIVEFSNNRKMQSIYRNMSRELGDNEIYKTLEKYTVEQKFHLKLFLENIRLDIDAISKLVKINKMRFNLINCCDENYNIKKIDLNDLSRNNEFFGVHSRDIYGINFNKLSNSLEKFKEDKIMDYSPDNSIKSIHKLRKNDINYLVNHLKCFDFPGAGSVSGFMENTMIDKMYKFSWGNDGWGETSGGFESVTHAICTLIGSVAWDNPCSLNLRLDIDQNEQIKNIAKFFESIVDIKKLSDIKISHDTVKTILSYYIEYKNTFTRRRLDDLESFVELFTVKNQNNKIDLCIALGKDNLRKQVLNKLLVYSDEIFEDKRPLDFKTISRIECDDTLGKAVYNICNIYVDNDEDYEDESFSDYLKEIDYLEYWNYGDYVSAINKIKMHLNDENTIQDEQQKFSLINNGTYISLSTNKFKIIESWFNYKAPLTNVEIRSYIKKNHDENPLDFLLFKYNSILIRNYIEKYSFNNLIKLLNEIIKNENGEILQQAKSSLLTCLIIKDQEKEVVFEEKSTMPVLSALIVSINNLKNNGYDLKMTKKLEVSINNFLEISNKK